MLSSCGPLGWVAGVGVSVGGAREAVYGAPVRLSRIFSERERGHSISMCVCVCVCVCVCACVCVCVCVCV